MMRRTLAVLGCGAVLCGLSVAQAAPRTHDGFYMQFNVGLGYYNTSAGEAGTDVSFSGLTIPSSFLMGGTLFNHLVIGGGFFCDTGPSPSYEVNGQSVELDNVTQYIIGLGGFVDYYVWSDRGLHFPLFLGWGGLETSADGNAGGSDPTGFITYFGGGYEFWMSDEWSIGALFRLVIAPSKLNDVSYTTIEPGFLLTLTYH